MRHWFGRTYSDWVMTPGDEVIQDETVVGYSPILVPDVTVTLWDAQDGGTQYTDLLDADDQAVTQIETDEFGNIPRFQGPDGVFFMWASASADGSEPRYLMATPTIGDAVADLESRAGETWRFSAPEAGAGAAFRAYNHTGRTLTAAWVHASAGIAPDAESLDIDILLNGSTPLTAEPLEIPAAATTSAVITAFDVDEIADGEYLTVTVAGDEMAAAIVVEIRVV